MSLPEVFPYATGSCAEQRHGSKVWLNGKRVASSRNLRGLYDYARRQPVDAVTFRDVSGALDGGWQAAVTVHYGNGAHGTAFFMDRTIAAKWGERFAVKRGGAFKVLPH